MRTGGPFHPRRARGQSFLRDLEIRDRIVAAIAPHPDQDFLEIGAGSGEMTLPLASAGAGRVLAIETDAVLFERLSSAVQKGGTCPARAIHADFLELDLPKLLADHGMKRVRVVGNLPFSVASPILLKLLDHRERLVDLTLMFQLEVAQRLIARLGTKPYGFLTVIAKQAAAVHLLFTIPSRAFSPRPKVHAALVRMELLGEQEPAVGDYQVFRALVRTLLTHRRKTISNNLKYLDSPRLDVSTIRAGLKKLSIEPSRRAETLSVEEFAALSHICASRR
jgi:16S rRNA (adenine1518-N6/adenine1519-N6)-dimethyltransferase